MMIVNRVEIRYDKIGTGTSINIPLKLDFTPVDNSELVETKFVDDEIEKSINPIVDYKKVRFKPAKVVAGKWEIIDKFKLQNVFFITGSTTPVYDGNNTTPSNYDTLDFTDADIFCRYNRLMRSFLSLQFYDSPYAPTNNLLFFSTIYTQILDDQKYDTGIALPAAEAPISYVIGDPILQPNTVHEGFHLYWYKDLVDNAPNQEYEMYMTALFNNANNSTQPNMYSGPTDPTNYTNSELSDFSSPDGKLYLKVILKYDTTDKQYKYTFAPNAQQTGVNWNVTTGIPTITFHQVSTSLI
jgi:hypothetical protein